MLHWTDQTESPRSTRPAHRSWHTNARRMRPHGNVHAPLLRQSHRPTSRSSRRAVDSTHTVCSSHGTPERMSQTQRCLSGKSTADSDKGSNPLSPNSTSGAVLEDRQSERACSHHLVRRRRATVARSRRQTDDACVQSRQEGRNGAARSEVAETLITDSTHSQPDRELFNTPF